MMQLCLLELSLENTLIQKNYRRIHKVWHESPPQSSPQTDESDFICLLSHPPRTVIYDLVLPTVLKKNMEREILFSELMERLPILPESVSWFYRNCGHGHYRICAVHHEEMSQL